MSIFVSEKSKGQFCKHARELVFAGEPPMSPSPCLPPLHGQSEEVQEDSLAITTINSHISTQSGIAQNLAQCFLQSNKEGVSVFSASDLAGVTTDAS